MPARWMNDLAGLKWKQKQRHEKFIKKQLFFESLIENYYPLPTRKHGRLKKYNSKLFC